MIYVMLLWLGAYNGGPATIQGFKSLQACQDSIPAVTEAYKAPWYGSGISIVAKCIALKNAE